MPRRSCDGNISYGYISIEEKEDVGSVFYFQVHQPFRIKRFRFSDVSKRQRYFADDKNTLILDKVARKCYLKTNSVLLELLQSYKGKFKVSFSISGVALEQMRMYSPAILTSFQQLVDTGCVEILSKPITILWRHFIWKMNSLRK